MQWVFGYGSLMDEPERPGAIVARRVGAIVGWRRRFDKRSVSRGCANVDASDRPVVTDFCDGVTRMSLVLGIDLAPGARLWGLALGYPDAVAAPLLADLEAREGPAYRRITVPVQTDGGPVSAWTWVSDPRGGRQVDLDLQAQAEILWAATPRASPDGRARGAAYLFGVERVLQEIGRADPYISDLADAVRALGGR